MIDYTSTNKNLTLEMNMNKFLEAIEKFSKKTY